MRTRIFLIIIILSLWLLSSCGGAAPTVEESAAEEPAAAEPAAEEPAAPEESPPKRIDELYVLESAVWESDLIPVCWENPDESNQAEREFIQAAIEKTWEAVSLVDFIGWGECNLESKGIRIQISDESPHTKGLGSKIDGLENGMVLNITFSNWGCVDTSGNRIACIFPYEDYSREDYIRISAVHEFGHALSFAHEQNRADTPSWCDAPQGAEGTLPIGGWDLDSVMNYCNPRWSGDGYLSEMDIAGVKMVYGMGAIKKEAKKI